MNTVFSRVSFPPHTTINGRTTRVISAREGRKLTRITEDGRDDLIIEEPGREPYVMPWARTNGGNVAVKPGTAKAKS